MPAPMPTPPLRYVSNRRLASPLPSAASETTRSNAAADTASGTTGGGVDGPINTVLPSSVQFGAAARVHYTNTLSSSEGLVERAREARDMGREEEEEEAAAMEYLRATRRGSASSSHPSPPVSGGGMASAGALPAPPPPPPPPHAPPPGSLLLHPTHGGTGGGIAAAATVGSSGSSGNSKHRLNPPPVSAEDCQATLHALRHENAMLRQRLEVLTSLDGTTEQGHSSTDPAATLTPEVSRAVLLRRIARLEAALRLEALERDVVEQRLLAQERVLRAVCMPVPPPAPTAGAGP